MVATGRGVPWQTPVPAGRELLHPEKVTQEEYAFPWPWRELLLEWFVKPWANGARKTNWRREMKEREIMEGGWWKSASDWAASAAAPPGRGEGAAGGRRTPFNFTGGHWGWDSPTALNCCYPAGEGWRSAAGSAPGCCPWGKGFVGGAPASAVLK